MIEWPSVHPVRVYRHRKHRVYLLFLVPATSAAVEAAGFSVCQLKFGSYRGSQAGSRSSGVSVRRR